jgi:TM2 domain-containing membrane protein YozV
MKKQVKATDKDLVLTFWFGWTGYWRFKCGQVGLGIFWLLTFGCFLIGWLVDIFACLAAIRRTRNASQKRTYQPQQRPPQYQQPFCPDIAPVMPRDELSRLLNGSRYYLNPRTMTMHWGDCRCIVGVKGMLTTSDYSAAKRSGYKECNICMKP